MQTPYVDPVGIHHTPAGYTRTPRPYSRSQRFAAALLVGIFASVVILTSAWSLGGYCLTSDGENTTDLPYRRTLTPRSA